MPQPKKYLDIVAQLLQFYQKQLIRLFKKYTNDNILEFKTQFDIHFKKLKDAQIAKSIQQSKATDICQPMNQFLQTSLRIKKTSQSDRYQIRPKLFSQQAHRFRFTGGLSKSPKNQKNIIYQKPQNFQLQEITKSYQVQDQLKPKMRMKWKSFNAGDQSPEGKQKQKATIGANNIDLLSYTIPEIENSIRRLSVPSRNGYEFDMYKTVDTKMYSNRKKFIRRLF